MGAARNFVCGRALCSSAFIAFKQRFHDFFSICDHHGFACYANSFDRVLSQVLSITLLAKQVSNDLIVDFKESDLKLKVDSILFALNLLEELLDRHEH